MPTPEEKDSSFSERVVLTTRFKNPEKYMPPPKVPLRTSLFRHFCAVSLGIVVGLYLRHQFYKIEEGKDKKYLQNDTSFSYSLKNCIHYLSIYLSILASLEEIKRIKASTRL
jgi:hypothetical protein